MSHVDDIKLEVSPKTADAPTYSVGVSFGFHCFTRDVVDTDTPDLHMIHDGERRCFCFERYELSKELAAAIMYAANGRAYFTQRANFLIVESLSQQNAPYVIFFNIEKAKKSDGFDAAMFVTSAHLRPDLPDMLPPVTFATLVDYKIQGKQLRRPEPRRVIAQKRK
ncbi:hypothetical protein [Rhodopseudomonas palustris]|uniref:hypothetical protein n=1 Tax=Rhodopseudomonas palustris TaxID=1076 RepID=UPI0012EE9F79